MLRSAGDVKDVTFTKANPSEALLRVRQGLDLAGDYEIGLRIAVAVKGQDDSRRNDTSHDARGVVLLGERQELDRRTQDVEGFDLVLIHKMPGVVVENDACHSTPP